MVCVLLLIGAQSWMKSLLLNHRQALVHRRLEGEQHFNVISKEQSQSVNKDARLCSRTLKCAWDLRRCCRHRAISFYAAFMKKRTINHKNCIKARQLHQCYIFKGFINNETPKRLSVSVDARADSTPHNFPLLNILQKWKHFSEKAPSVQQHGCDVCSARHRKCITHQLSLNCSSCFHKTRPVQRTIQQHKVNCSVLLVQVVWSLIFRSTQVMSETLCGLCVPLCYSLCCWHTHSRLWGVGRDLPIN